MFMFLPEGIDYALFIDILSDYISAKMIATGFAIAGRFGMGGLFCMIFLYTTELYPTVIRQVPLRAIKQSLWRLTDGIREYPALFMTIDRDFRCMLFIFLKIMVITTLDINASFTV